MNSPCGCRSAEECWQHCCCHTLAERLEWARENHVQPPDFALAEAKAQGIAWGPAIRPKCSAEQDCCGEPACSAVSEKTCSCCCHHDRTANAELLNGRSEPKLDSHRRGDQSAAPGIVLIKALECQGIGANWLAGIVSLPPPRVVRWTMLWNPLARIVAGGETALSFSAPPPTRPPRSTVV